MELLREGRWRLLLVCWLGWLFDLYTLVLYNVLQAPISKELGFDDRTNAWINGLSMLATAAGGIGVGWLADHVGRRFAFLVSVATYAAGSALTALAWDFPSMLVLRLLTGLGVGGEWGVGQAVVAENLPDHLRGRAAGILQAGSPMATALAALVSGLLVAPLGWRGCFALSSLCLLMVPAALLVIPRGRLPEDQRGRMAELFAGDLLRPSLVVFLLLTLNMAGYWCTYTFFYKYLENDLHQTRDFILKVQLVISTGQLAGNVSFGFFADRFPRRSVFTAYSLLFAIGALAVALFFKPLSEHVVLLVAATTAVGIGAGNWACFGALFGDLFPARVRGVASSGFYNVSRGIQLVTLQVVVGLAQWAAIPAGQSGLFLGALFTAAAAVAAFLLPRVTATPPGGRWTR